jgi:hypothetical protein
MSDAKFSVHGKIVEFRLNTIFVIGDGQTDLQNHVLILTLIVLFCQKTLSIMWKALLSRHPQQTKIFSPQ